VQRNLQQIFQYFLRWLSQRTEDGVYHIAPGEGEKLAQTFHALAQKTPLS